jgi:anthranilate synthase/aminodeoxychorismate synthase-like glutamine amidotransferase
MDKRQRLLFSGQIILFRPYFRIVLLLLDNYDSFTYNLYDYFCQSGAQVEVMRNDEVEVNSISQKYTGIILSPGPGEPKDAGRLMEVIDRYHNTLPMFGVCLGMQALGEYFGAKLEQANYPMHGKVSTLRYDDEHPMFAHTHKPLDVCRYHSLLLSGIEKTDLEITAQTNANEPMAIAHRSLPIWAVQYHPEAILTQQGFTLLNNWLSCFYLRDTKHNNT